MATGIEVENVASLRWSATSGFEIDLTAGDEEITVQLVGVPVPADGTVELGAGPVSLDKLEILFKAQVVLEGEPGQLRTATVQLIKPDTIRFFAQVEDVETGQVVPFEVELPIAVPKAAPPAGGPRPNPTQEDELDWEDDATFEKLLVDMPDLPTSERPKPKVVEEPKKKGGLAALLAALSKVDEEDDDEEPTEVRLGLKLPDAPKAPAAPMGPPKPTANLEHLKEARDFVALLVEREAIEFEEDFDREDLYPGILDILHGGKSPPQMAKRMSKWLLDQDGVGDLFIDDDDLAELLSQW